MNNIKNYVVLNDLLIGSHKCGQATRLWNRLVDDIKRCVITNLSWWRTKLKTPIWNSPWDLGPIDFVYRSQVRCTDELKWSFNFAQYGMFPLSFYFHCWVLPYIFHCTFVIVRNFPVPCKFDIMKCFDKVVVVLKMSVLN